jgi:GNAT superfamily N-acetyltransferase
VSDFVCEVLAGRHDLSDFSCGKASLDDWLRKSARDSDGRNITRTYVLHDEREVVVGYYSLAPYFIERGAITRKQARGLPDRIPCYLLARLALDRSVQGQGLGTQLLASAVIRAATGSRSLGGRFVVVDAIDDEAESFYLNHAFQLIPGQERRLVLPVKDIDATLRPFGDSTRQ